MNTANHISNVDPNPQAQRKYADRVLGTFSVLLGVLTVIMGMLPAVGWFSFIPGGIAIILAIISISKSMRAHASARMATLGIVLAVVGILAFVIPNTIMATNDQRQPEQASETR